MADQQIKTRGRPSFFRVSLEQQMLLVKRLSIMLRAGVPIAEALRMMLRQTESRSTRFVVEELSRGVEKGRFLHVVLGPYRKYFGDLAINIIRVGEVSGTLHENLHYLSEELKKRKDLRRKILSAMIYPALIVIATIGVTLLLTLYVFPKILPLLQSFHGQLPISTRVLIMASAILGHWGWLIGLGGLGCMVSFGTALKKSLFLSRIVDSVLLRVPLFGKLFQSYHMANFCRTMGILLRSDVRVVEATTIAAHTMTNLVYRENLLLLALFVTKGYKISDYLEKYPKLYPPMVVQMVTVGENTGKMTETLLYLSDIYETEVDEITKNLSTTVEPMLMIFMGVLVGFVAMSIITPIYAFTQGISGNIR